MKLLLYCIIAFCIPCEVISQWFWQNPLPQGNLLTEVVFVSPKTGFAVGFYGTLLKTSDGGITWNVQDVNKINKYHFFSICFLDSLIGVIVGYEDNNLASIILRTTDGGLNWSEIPFYMRNQLRQVVFPNENFGIIVGYDLLLVSSDKGESWEVRSNDSLDNYHILSGSFADEKVGLVFAENDYWYFVRRTTDGGLNWQNTAGLSGGDVKFIDSKTAILSDADTVNKIYRSTDAGLSWEVQQPGEPGWKYLTINFYNEKRGVILAQKYNPSLFPYYQYGFLLTSDGGISWIFKNIDALLHLIGISFTDENTLIAFGYGGLIMRSTDLGISWTIQSQGSYAHLTSIYFTDNDKGVAVGTKILKTTNRGKSWTEQSVGSNNRLYCVSFFDKRLGLTAGIDGTLLKTTDEGYNWERIETGTFASLRSIELLSEKKWIIAGGTNFFTDGIVLMTTDAGLTWNVQQFPDVPCKDIAFTDSLTGWIVSSGGTLKTTDGGLTWNLQPEIGLSIAFADEHTGYISGFHYLYKTTDRGVTWSGLELPLNGVSIFFTDADNGTVVGHDKIFRTTNGGIDWFEQFRSSPKLNDVFFIDKENGFVVGDYGTILATTNGGGIISDVTPASGEQLINYYLQQNYPNPFNPATTIKYSLPQSGRVTLFVYDLLGREIIKLLDEEKPAGDYNVTWNASNSPSGVYFMRMQAGQFSETRKLVLMK